MRLAEEGADVIAVDIARDVETVPFPGATPEGLKETVALVEALDRRIVSAVVDVRDRAALPEAVGRGVRTLGGLAIVVANAGIFGTEALSVRCRSSCRRGTADLRRAIWGFCQLLVVAGNETAATLIGMGSFSLRATPTSDDAVEDPSRWPAAVEEVVRIESPTQVVRGLATEDVSVHGPAISAGSRVMLVFGAANRDEREFSEPDRFDITRKIQWPLAFGRGPLPRRPSRPARSGSLVRGVALALSGLRARRRTATRGVDVGTRLPPHTSPVRLGIEGEIVMTRLHSAARTGLGPGPVVAFDRGSRRGRPSRPRISELGRSSTGRPGSCPHQAVSTGPG
ncbi:cytochrome P450 [Pseudonocardia lutea]|uniref:Cytochrome P450 n=1 Tax=Pseudonocardia lutea TaxID=2172015 RepID=A0ABW1I9M5_9PSEU